MTVNRSSSRRNFLLASSGVALAGLAGCTGNSEDDTNNSSGNGSDDGSGDGSTLGDPVDPANAERVAVDRFSDDAGTLLQRSKNASLPDADEPIDFDQLPFFHTGLDPDGNSISYYNFDVQSTTPAPIYVLFREDGSKVEGQMNLIDVIPGDSGYNDFWQVTKVTVPDSYEANSATSVQELLDAGFETNTTMKLVNCPVVPEGSTASKRAGDGDTGLVDGWYDGMVVSYFAFEEASLTASSGSVPTSPIYVTFNKNPGMDGGGPPSGFMTEMGSAQNHNVVATTPSDGGYSPLWAVNVYDNADFDSVMDLSSAMDATILDSDGPNVNCPLV